MKKRISILSMALISVIALTNCKNDNFATINNILISPSSVSVFEGEEVSFITNVTTDKSGANLPEIIWKTDDENVALIKKGIMTAQKQGYTTITATSGGKSATCGVDVKVYISATSLTLNKDKIDINVGDKTSILSVITPSNASAKIPYWELSNEGIITIDKYGEITALKIGTVTATAIVDKLKATCVVTVK
ncbi:MAG: Ig-like domain-containing protein [Bacteroidetes bacterium]|nr:Ig-like domain-containing protein [Bacteroidota bacterium]